ncbi:MAG: hypothetical protein N2C12_14645, partial [Planctomycetales bacterium]
TRQELDLVQLPGDRHAAGLLLPTVPVSIGSKWNLDPAALAMLLGLDEVGDSDVTSTLVSVEGRYAKVEMEGTVHGATEGVAAEIAMRVRYFFDLRRGRLATLQLVTRETREIGSVTPGVEATARLKMTVTSRTQPSPLTGHAVEMAAGSGLLSYSSADLGISFQHDRRWHITAKDKTAVVMRRIDRGELVAQCNVSSLPKQKDRMDISLTDFKEKIRNNLGDEFGRFIGAEQSTSGLGDRVFRVEISGTVSQLPIRWIYYHFLDEHGRRIALVFTMEESLLERFGPAAGQIVDSLDFIDDP